MSIITYLKNKLAPSVGQVEQLIHHPIYPTPWYFAEVIKGKCYRGSWPDAEHLRWLVNAGVTASMNFCAERRQDELIRSVGIRPYNIPVIDNTAPTDAQMDEALEIFDAINGALFAHCEQGRGRTGCITAGIRVKRCSWTPQAALQEAMYYGLQLESQKAFILELKP